MKVFNAVVTRVQESVAEYYPVTKVTHSYQRSSRSLRGKRIFDATLLKLDVD